MSTANVAATLRVVNSEREIMSEIEDNSAREVNSVR